MAVLATRQFECILCHQQFSRVTPDLIPPWTVICSECLEKLLALEGKALPEYLAAAHLAAEAAQAAEFVGSPTRPHPWEKQIIATVQRVKLQRDDRTGGDRP